MLHLPAAILCPALSVTLSGLELPQVRSDKPQLKNTIQLQLSSTHSKYMIIKLYTEQFQVTLPLFFSNL